MAGKETLLGQLRDSGLSALVVNRVEQLLGMFGDNIPQFCSLSKGALEGAYVRSHPGSKGLGQATYDAFDSFVRLYKQSLCEAREAARKTVEVQEAREAEKASMRQELLDREIEFDALTNAMAALGMLKLQKCSLGRLLDMYELAKRV